LIDGDDSSYDTQMPNDAQAISPSEARPSAAPVATASQQAVPPRASRRALARAVDPVLGTLGVAMGWVSLCFPFGRDQGLYYYVAREWMLRDQVPYRDVLDHKTPGIYMVHALAVKLFGEVMWGIRVLDMSGVLCTGLVAATFAAPRGQPVPVGTRGAAILAANLFFFGSLNFWDTSQSELWYSLLGVSSVMAARRFTADTRAQLAAGAFAGAALIMKPPAIWFVLIAIVVLVLRVLKRREHWLKRLLLAGARFSGGVAAVVVPILGYFGVRGAWPAMLEIVVRSNALYAQQERGVQTAADVLQRLSETRALFGGLVPLLFLGLLFGLAFARDERGLRGRNLLALALALASLVGLVMQLKFYLLHYVVILAPATVICALLATDLGRLYPQRQRALGAGPLLFAVVILLCWSRTFGAAQWVDENRITLQYLRGEITREEFTRFFALPGLGYWFEDSERVGTFLREHTSPEDTVAVRGFEPEIYAVAQRHYPGRFFWTTFLVSPTRGTPEMSKRWLEEDRSAIEQRKPRYIVALTGIGNGPDSVPYLEALGYKTLEVVHNLTIMERVGP
jgi:hypothetical protein